jgi:hypothetical protein
LLVSPRVGAVDEEMLKRVVLETLGSYSDAARMMAEHWRQADTLKVVRREPVATAESKIPLLRGRRLRVGRTA